MSSFKVYFGCCFLDKSRYSVLIRTHSRQKGDRKLFKRLHGSFRFAYMIWHLSANNDISVRVNTEPGGPSSVPSDEDPLTSRLLRFTMTTPHSPNPHQLWAAHDTTWPRPASTTSGSGVRPLHGNAGGREDAIPVEYTGGGEFPAKTPPGVPPTSSRV